MRVAPMEAKFLADAKASREGAVLQTHPAEDCAKLVDRIPQ